MWQIKGVMDLWSLPPWAIALALGAAAPLCVRYVADTMERRAQKRTAELVAEADRQMRSGRAGPMVDGPMVAGPMVAGPMVDGPMVDGPMMDAREPGDGQA
jgi:hypothetical protein